eukprot:CAMPEP_0172745742 /NCGR_PEP_ID=MMETSP1074-20121228/138711_1 /TAXON_ID=2916 /ORGANISM="Ceratium fusus, Strain PA161109" /LENGTH=60 /DNA_ID=CAMNT_0013576989 /DNA_START=84 /DNA_END=263 /DNA_ORIENTATION=-
MADCYTPDCLVQLSKPRWGISQPSWNSEPEETIPSKNDRLCDKDEFALGKRCPTKCPFAA